MVIKVHEFSRGIIELEKEDGIFVSGGLRLPPEQIYRIRPLQQEIPNVIKVAVMQGDFEIPDDYSPLIATDAADKEVALVARDLGDYAVLAVATGHINAAGDDTVVGYRYFWLYKDTRPILDGIKTLLHWWWKKGCPCYEINPLVWNQQTSSKEFYDAENLEYDDQAITTATLPDSIPIILQFSQGEKLNLESLEKLHHQVVRLYKYNDIIVNHTRQEFPFAWAWNVRCVRYPSKFTAIAGILDEGMDIVKNQLQGAINLPSRIMEKYQELEVNVSETTQEVMVNDISCESAPIEDIRKLLISIANNPSNNQKIVELLSCLGIYPPNVWESCLDKETIAQAQNSPLVNIVNYRALAALLVPKLVPEWLSWIRAQKITKESLIFQEEIWETCRQNATARENLRSLIRGGIAQLLCELTKPTISDTTYQNIEWLLVREQKENVWHDRFRTYTNDIVDRLESLISKNPDEHQDDFYALLGETLKKLEKASWNSTYPEFLRIAKMIEKYEKYELAAVFYQISSGGVPNNVWGAMSRVDSQAITEHLPLKKGIR